MASEFMFNKCRGVTQRIEFIPNGIDTARFRFDLKARIKERVRLDFGNDLVIGSVGRFCYQKNQSFLIEIFNEVLKHRPDSRLLLVGEGESRDVLIDKVQQLGLEDSIIHQTYRNLEIIVVVNGSTDHCGKICIEYATRDERICVVQKEHGTIASARNVGLEVASGDWIGFVDSVEYRRGMIAFGNPRFQKIGRGGRSLPIWERPPPEMGASS